MTEPMRTILESEFLGLHTVLRQRLVRIDQLEAALDECCSDWRTAKWMPNSAMDNAQRGSAAETPVAQSKSQQKRLDTMRARIVTETADAIAAQSETDLKPCWCSLGCLLKMKGEVPAGRYCKKDRSSKSKTGAKHE